MFISTILKLLAILFLANCYVCGEANNRCLVGTRDYETLMQRQEESPMKYPFPWSVEIHQFHEFIGYGAIISNKHVLAPASNILPNRGDAVEISDDPHSWVENTNVVMLVFRRNINHVYVHPKYNLSTYDYNIAVMELDEIILVHYIFLRPVFFPKTPLAFSGGKVNIAFPIGTTLKPYMATVMSDEDCARINGRANVSTNTLMCIDGLCTDHDCHASRAFSQPIFSINPDKSIEIIGLPLWIEKSLEVFNSTTMRNETRKVSVYIRIRDSMPWLEEILSNRCDREPPTPNDCTQPMFFSTSCARNRIRPEIQEFNKKVHALQTLFTIGELLIKLRS